MEVRTLFLNIVLLVGVAALAAGIFVLLTGVDLRYASPSEAFVVTWLPYLFIAFGLVAVSTPFWRHKVR